jgi:glycosyltransferase involved in cell wall biosynthesis
VQTSIITCVNDFETYDRCVVSSFQQKSKNVELVPVDNTSCKWSVPSALNYGFRNAKGQILVFCHQDVRFPTGWLEKMFAQIAIVEKNRRNWGVLGPYGVSMNGKCVGNVIDPHNSYPSRNLPIKVQSLDELCLITRRDNGLLFDEELGGFHFYGADLCLQAMAMGMVNFAIDACVEHLSPGPADASFAKIAHKLFDKWRNKDCPLRVITTTCGIFRLQAGLKAEFTYTFTKYKAAFKRRVQRIVRDKTISLSTKQI